MVQFLHVLINLFACLFVGFFLYLRQSPGPDWTPGRSGTSALSPIKQLGYRVWTHQTGQGHSRTRINPVSAPFTTAAPRPQRVYRHRLSPAGWTRSWPRGVCRAGRFGVVFQLSFRTLFGLVLGESAESKHTAAAPGLHILGPVQSPARFHNGSSVLPH